MASSSPADAESNRVDSDDDSSRICPICLTSIENEAYTDTCKHCFCLECILQWTEIEKSHGKFSSCPSCKTEFRSLLHNFLDGDFDRTYLTKREESALDFQLSDIHRERRKVYFNKNPIVHQPLSLSNANLEQLAPWLTIELQALTQLEDVDIIVKHVAGIVQASSQSGSQRGVRRGHIQSANASWQEEVTDAVAPFVFENAKRFTEQLTKFLASGGKLAQSRTVSTSQSQSANWHQSVEVGPGSSHRGQQSDDDENELEEEECFVSHDRSQDLGFKDDW